MFIIIYALVINYKNKIGITFKDIKKEDKYLLCYFEDTTFYLSHNEYEVENLTKEIFEYIYNFISKKYSYSLFVDWCKIRYGYQEDSEDFIELGNNKFNYINFIVCKDNGLYDLLHPKRKFKLNKNISTKEYKYYSSSFENNFNNYKVYYLVHNFKVYYIDCLNKNGSFMYGYNYDKVPSLKYFLK